MLLRLGRTDLKNILSLCAAPKIACPPLAGLGVIKDL